MPLPRQAASLTRALPALALLAGACGGEAPTGLHGQPGVHVVAGADVTDTIQSRPLQALVAEVRDARGQPLRGVVVRFEARPMDGEPADPWGQSYYGAYVTRLDGSYYVTLIADTTDERGRASALVQLGTRAGAAEIVVAAPEIGGADTARFTVTPGAAARLVIAPADTTLVPGGSLTLRGGVTDRAGNVRTDALSYSVIGTGVSAAGGVVTAQAPTRARVVAQAGTRADTTSVTVVPAGTLAATTWSSLLTFGTDGSSRTTVVGTDWEAYVTDWSPDGTEILYDEVYGGELKVVNVGTRAVRRATTMSALYGRFSADGTSLYYSAYGGSPSAAWHLYRQARDGTGEAPVSMSAPSTDYYPSPSPDGTRIAYMTRTSSPADTLKVLTLATGESVTLGIVGSAPSWSPSGNDIAFVDGVTHELKLTSPTGTNVRTLNPSGRYGGGIDWSPDGRWVVAVNSGTRLIELIDTQSTLVLPLTFTSGWTAPSWKP